MQQRTAQYHCKKIIFKKCFQAYLKMSCVYDAIGRLFIELSIIESKSVKLAVISHVGLKTHYERKQPSFKPYFSVFSCQNSVSEKSSMFCQYQIVRLLDTPQGS